MVSSPFEDVENLAKDVTSMRIRGARAIAIAAARALLAVAERSKASSVDEFLRDLDKAARILLQTRPTAVSLANSIRYIMHRVYVSKSAESSVGDVRATAIASAKEFIANSEAAIKRIGEIGARRIRDGDVILTHCHSSAVTSILTEAWRGGKHIQVYVTETRPRLQGWITATELSKEGIPVTLVVDSAVRFFMAEADKVLVGADAIAANGAVVNKIGTSLVALAAREARVRFFVAAETYKFSPETMFGELVKIEERDPSEVVPPEKLKALPNLTVRNPAFDVTPPEYIDLIITERGIIPPQGAIMVLQELYGSLSLEEMREYQTYEITDLD